jgi:polysulfide reductase chain C
MKTHDILTLNYMEGQNMMIEPKLQTEWGWLVALYLFLAGLGGGTFLFSFILLFMDKFNNPAHIGLFIGPILVAIGSFLLLFDLGSPSQAFRLFTTLSTWKTSWLVRGSWILTVFIILGLAYALPSLGIFSWLPWTQTSGLGLGIGTVAAIFSLFVMIYPGLLLAVNNSIPLWNTSVLPVLFFFSGLDTGLAAFILFSMVLPSTIGVEGYHLLAGIDSTILVVLLIVLASYLYTVRQTGQTAAVSVNLLLSPLFVWGVIVAGLLIPLAILVSSATVSDVATIRVLDTVASLLILGGAFLLRFGVVKSGIRIPVIS